MYTDVLTKIKNAQAARLPNVKVAFSGMDMAILEILASRGYLASAEKKGRNPKRVIDVQLKYADGRGAIRGIRFVSVPSRRIARGYRELRPTLAGYGVALISTPKGIMTFEEARKQKLGGMVLFEIW
jgi:small subunit ribosomal protein S8